MKLYGMVTFVAFCMPYCLIQWSAGSASGREITDMSGRKVVVPDVIRSAYAPSPYGSTMLYSVAPDMMAGLMSPLKEEEKKYLNPVVHNLPVLGRLSGRDAPMDSKPDVIIVWADKGKPNSPKTDEMYNSLGIPYVNVAVGDHADLRDYPAAYDFLGELLGRKEHTAKESAYCRKLLTDVDALVRKTPKAKRPKVYYAEGDDGLSTEYDDSLHVHLLKLVGDVNIHRGHTTGHMGFEKVTMDQMAAYNPDVIIAQSEAFYRSVRKDPAWRSIKAVREGRIHLIPRLPHNWFDRPPSFMRIIGLKWLMGCLYPEEYKIDLPREVKKFYDLFLGVSLTDADVQTILHPPPEAGGEEATAAETIVDMCGKKIDIPFPPKRIACMHCVSPEKIMTLGKGNYIRVMAEQSPWAYRLFPEIKAARIEKGTPPEQLLAMNIDAVLYTPAMTQEEAYSTAGLKTICAFSDARLPGTVDEYVANFKRQVSLFGDLLGPDARAKAEKYNAYFEEKVKQILAVTSEIERGDRPSVYYGGLKGNPLSGQGNGSVMHWNTEVAGGNYLPQALPGNHDKATLEQVVSWDPDIILLGGACDSVDVVAKDPAWAGLKAVKTGNVYLIPQGIYTWDHGSNEGVLLMIYLAKLFHPDLFRDWDVLQEMKTFYGQVYGKRLSDEDIEKILDHRPPT